MTLYIGGFLVRVSGRVRRSVTVSPPGRRAPLSPSSSRLRARTSRRQSSSLIVLRFAFSLASGPAAAMKQLPCQQNSKSTYEHGSTGRELFAEGGWHG